ncbi:MAG: sugar transferase [Thermoleophilia bacterium]|nr:sugar transferase [Thermoleophilia bacterium]
MPQPAITVSTLYEEIRPLLDERTARVLDRRRASAAERGRGWLIRRALAGADVAGLTLAFAAAALLFAGEGTSNVVGDAIEFGIFFATLPCWILVARLYGLYASDEERTDHSTADDVVGVFHLVTVGSFLFFVGAAASGLADPPVPRVLAFWLLAILFVTVFRALARALCRRASSYLQSTIIVGAGDVGQLVARKFRQHPEYGINLLGFVDDEPRAPRPGLDGLPLLGGPDRLAEIVRALDVERVVVAFSKDSHEETLGLVRSLQDLHVRIDIVPRLFEILGTNVGIHTAEGLPLIGLPPLRLSGSSRLLKRTMDIALAGTFLVLLAPLLGLVAVAIRLDTRGPVLFRQVRMGSGNLAFRIYKFRTMVSNAETLKLELAPLNKHAREGGDPRMFKIPDDPRVTRVGQLLRRYSLDELPQLVNVLRGEMSLVGPRPLILDEDRYVVDWRRRRLDLKPGITGLWQVLGRDDIPFDEMVKLDYLYVTTWSLMNDLKLLLRTFPVVLRSRAT